VGVLVNWATLAILLLSSLVVVALFVIRRRDGADAPFRCPGYPVVPAVYLVASLGVALASAIEFPKQSLYGVLIIAAGLPVYALVKRRRTD
jgi:APA family basic amino acid/polyamine antiporter